MAKTREYMALRRQAYGGRPLVRRGGGKWLGWVIPRCCEQLGASTGALVQELARKLGTPRDRIYRVMRGRLGIAPDALWRVGRALHEMGVYWMSGPLALALEPRYEAHLLGVVGEVILERMHFLWRGNLQDFLWNRTWFRNADDHAIKCIEAYGCFNSEMHAMFESAWQRWYAFGASDLATKECEAHFADKAPAIAKAVSLLRAQQRDHDSESHEKTYRVHLHDLNKDIREYFEVGGYEGRPLYARRKHAVEVSPRFNLLSHDRSGQTEFGKQLQRLIAPEEERPSPSDAYRNGWDLSVRGASGLLALALLDYEREYYLLIAGIAKQMLPLLKRVRDGRPTRSDVEQLRRYKAWWKSAWAIACVVGPLDEPLSFLSDDVGNLVAAHMGETRKNKIEPWLLSVSDYHEALFADSAAGAQLRNMITIPDEAASELSRFSISSTYTASDYDSSTTPGAMATVLAMLHRSEFGYPTGTTRTELFWWFEEVAEALESIG